MDTVKELKKLARKLRKADMWTMLHDLNVIIERLSKASKVCCKKTDCNYYNICEDCIPNYYIHYNK